MGGLACGFALANAGRDTRSLQAYLGHRKQSAHGPVHRASAGPVQGFLAVADMAISERELEAAGTIAPLIAAMVWLAVHELRRRSEIDRK
jgi:hypothetical protein